MPNELELPTPLDGSEIKHAIAVKIAEAIQESLDKRSVFFGKAYPKFKATWHVEYVLDNFGLIYEGSVRGELPSQDYEPERDEFVPSAGEIQGETVVIDGAIPFTPPNQLRKETGQPVTVQVTNERGLQESKAVVYKPKDRRPKISRAVVR